jgi:hypothetical protein
MATQPKLAPTASSQLKAELVQTFPGLRVLAWDNDVLYASRGYTLLRSQATERELSWTPIAHCRPPWWRTITSRHRLSFRLVRDGFHALAIHPSGNLIAAVPGAIVTLRSGQPEFAITHRIQRGTRPLHIAALPDGTVLWGEYFDNPARDEVLIYASTDAGITWNVAYTFPRNSIRHVHNIVYDRWQNCLWIFTGDYGRECRILRASLDLGTVDEVISGNQQARAVAAIATSAGIFIASDTPLEQNHIYFLDRRGNIDPICPTPNSSIYACQNRAGLFFSTMIEPSAVNLGRDSVLFGSASGSDWNTIASWRKDRFSMRYFQYGNVFLPDGTNTTNLLAATTIALNNADLTTFIWRTTAS